MIKFHIAFLVASLSLLGILAVKKTDKVMSIQWESELNDNTFNRAKKEGKGVLLVLKANWCHWCHVMDDSTFSNQEVKNYISDHFIAVRLDQDAHPELASRYRKYGWPATIVFDKGGKEVTKYAGFATPDEYLALLSNVINQKTEPPVLAKRDQQIVSDVELLSRLEANFRSYKDDEKGGFPSAMRFVEEESYELANEREVNPEVREWMIKSVVASFALNDEVWGGVYQYSTHSDWNHAHFEKLLSIQARYLRIYSQYAVRYSDNNATEKANDILKYCRRFLKQPTGLFANAQDADVVKGRKAKAYYNLNNKDRLAIGIPAIDTNTYTHSNADFGMGLLYAIAAQPDEVNTLEYKQLLSQLLKRKNELGLYNHSYKAQKTAALRDNLAMAKLFVAHLKLFPDDQEIKTALQDLVKNIQKRFQLKDGTFSGFYGDLGISLEPVLEENIALGRVLNWYSVQYNDKNMRKNVVKLKTYFIQKDQQEHFFHEPALIAFLKEVETEPEHIVAVNDIQQKLAKKAFILAPFYTLLAQYRKGKSAEQDALFSDYKKSAVFICTSSFCSSPLINEHAISHFFAP